jgi:hypothetical protein
MQPLWEREREMSYELMILLYASNISKWWENTSKMNCVHSITIIYLMYEMPMHSTRVRLCCYMFYVMWCTLLWLKKIIMCLDIPYDLGWMSTIRLHRLKESANREATR